jgi:hypothetical protein
MLGQVGRKAHVLDVKGLGFRMVEDQFLQALHLLGGDGFLAQSIEKIA